MEQFSIKSEGKNLDRSFTFNFPRKMKVCEVGAALERAADIIEDNWTNQTDTEQRKNECPGRHERMMRETGGWSDNLWWKLLRAKCWHLAYNKVIQTNCVSETKVFVFKKLPDFLTSSLVDNQSFSRNMKRRWRHSLPQDSLCRHSDQSSSRRSRSNCCLPRWWIHPVWSLCLLKIYVCQQINPLQINNAIFRPSRATSI